MDQNELIMELLEASMALGLLKVKEESVLGVRSISYDYPPYGIKGSFCVCAGMDWKKELAFKIGLELRLRNLFLFPCS